MIVHTPQKIISDSCVEISAKFEFEQPLSNLPKKLWYRFPKDYSPLLNTRSDAFIATALLMAMYTGEDLEVFGDISPLLLKNLLVFQDTFVEWVPEMFQKVSVKCHSVCVPPTEPGNDMYLTCFSGGLDSLYTILDSQTGHSGKAPKVTHGIYLSGLDLRLEDKEKYEDTYKVYDQLFSDVGYSLLKGETNVYQFSQFRINWRLFYSPATVSIAHLFSSRVRQFYLPSTGKEGVIRYYGSSTPVTPFFASENIKVSNHGFGTTRFEKLDAIIEWPAAHHKLKVCSDKLKLNRLQNCSRCHKCYPIKMWIKVQGEEDKFTNFDYKMSFWDYLHWGNQPVLNSRRMRIIQQAAYKKGQYKTAFLIEFAVGVHLIRRVLLGLVHAFLKREWIYAIKRRVYSEEKSAVNEDLT